MPVLTPATARSTSSTWSEVRSAALERATALPFPTADEEIWRYSRIAELDLSEFTPIAATTTIDGGGDAVVRVTGTVDASLSELFSHTTGGDLFGELNLAHMDVIVVRVPRNTVIEQPIVITHTADVDGAMSFPRLVIDAAENSEVTVVERFVSADGVRSLIVPVLDARTAQAARVRYLGINELGDRTWLIGQHQSVGQRDSDTLLATVALGGDYARVSTAARLDGQGGNTRQVALYFAGGDQMHDFRTLQEHVAPRTTSDLLFKGAVQDTAKSVYTGLIKIHKNAKGSAAFQTNRNLTLSHGAWAESVPNLDIETNDVKCSHASTVGPIDEDQLFYLESRGVNPDEIGRAHV